MVRFPPPVHLLEAVIKTEKVRVFTASPVYAYLTETGSTGTPTGEPTGYLVTWYLVSVVRHCVTARVGRRLIPGETVVAIGLRLWDKPGHAVRPNSTRGFHRRPFVWR